MPGAIALQLIGEAAEDELLRSVASYGGQVGKDRSDLAKIVGSDSIRYVSVQPFEIDEEGNQTATDTNSSSIDGWWASAVPFDHNWEWYSEEFKTFDEAMARAKEIAKLVGGRPVYVE